MVAETSARPLLGRNAAVTGGARGIGRAIAMELGRQGANLIITYRREEHLASAVAGDIRALGASCTSVHVDVRNQEDLEALFEEGRQRYGKIDILVNNAGVTEDGLVVRMSDDSWDRVIETNLRGAFFCMRAVGPHMLERGSGKVVNISSINAERAGRYRFTYDTSKAALNRMTKSIAVEWARHGVQVNAICATYVDTDLIRVSMEDERLRSKILAEIPMRRLADAREVGLVTAFLSSSASDFMTGACVFLDGGSTS